MTQERDDYVRNGKKEKENICLERKSKRELKI
jgi:hypothetical protein